MCDQNHLERWAKKELDRRTFGAAGLAGMAAACAPVDQAVSASGEASAVTMRKVSFATGEGTLDGEFYTSGTTPRPGVIFWPDIAGIRPAKRQMATRLAEEGYAVLLANPYYRDVAGQQFEDFASFAASGGFQTVRPWRGKFTAETKRLDNAAAARWLMQQDEVARDRGIGVQGYCMTGGHALYGPWSEDVISAGASFHGGGLVTGSETSPHRTLQEDGHYLIAISQDDDAEAPTHAGILREAGQDTAGAEVEVYAADHGFCVLDSPSYDKAEAERAWARLLALYSEAL
ncbi:dienelactone hydrolase family protein [Qipengyuania gelatinilytica]|uniref:Dienelactone hydrolase family protein n=1 Tax=Qipengyuania gelatinilytica TaxID=2867231 RepID=A0ABX9A5J1_9SPHN|nr:dienelactone hydrolase family protein [Qipengyuania gelatinilytica]QZD96369.1 dienelactone hydrolase family protein [Qipengyuania gelatinilytica]